MSHENTDYASDNRAQLRWLIRRHPMRFLATAPITIPLAAYVVIVEKCRRRRTQT